MPCAEAQLPWKQFLQKLTPRKMIIKYDQWEPVPLEDKLTDLFPLSLTHVSIFVAHLGTA